MTRVFQFIIVSAIVTGSVAAQTDSTFTYQGELKESGEPANGSYNLDFALWDAISGGSQVGSTIQFNGQPVSDGLFTVELDFGAAAFDGSQLWLEIAVDGNELVPRQPLTGAPFALQTRGIVVDADNNVGIGTSTPVCELQVVNLTPGVGAETAVTADDAAGAMAAYSSSLPPPFEHYAGRVSLFSDGATMGLDLRADAAAGDMRFYTGGPWLANERMRITENGNVGIGTSPAHRLHVTHDVPGKHTIYAVHTAENSDFAAINGVHNVSDYYGIGVLGEGGYKGVEGIVYAEGPEWYYGVYGGAFNGSGHNCGVFGTASGSGAVNYGVYSSGDCHVAGTLSKTAGSFKIDHPLDPANMYLYHSFVESPDMMNIYNGNVITDAAGYATIDMPDWFDALNAEFRYQLTVIDDSDDFILAKVTQKMHNNRFTIRTSAPYIEVSWQVTGIRIDAYAREHRIPVEEYKPARERGLYEHPELFGYPKERGINYVHSPEARQRN